MIADAAVRVCKLAVQREAKKKRRIGNKEKGKKARVEYRKRPPAKRSIIGESSWGVETLGLMHCTPWHW